MAVIAKSSAKTIPHAPKYPFVGSIPQVLSQQVDFLTHAHEHCGDIYKLDLGVTSVVMVCTPELAQYVLRDRVKNFAKGGPMWASIRTMLGNGLVVSEGDFWLRQRRMMQPHFHRQYLASITELMLNAIEEGMQQWNEWAQQGTVVNMLDAFNHITMKVIVKTMFGENLKDADADEMGRNMAYALDFMLQNMITQGLPDWLPVPGRQRYQAALECIDQFIYGVVAQRRQDSQQQKDLLGMLLQLVDEETGEAMSDQQIRDEVATIFLAGYETTALTLTWGIHHLNHHPAVVAKLTEEIDTVLGKNAPTFESLTQLPYTRMVLQEIMRLHPPAFWIPRTAIEDDELEGYPIKAGQMVGVSIYNIHHHPQIWANPEVFDPERFAAEQSEGRHQLAWLPFGAGQRLCLGRDFAMMEGALVLALMLQRYTFAATDHTPRPSLSTTLRPKDGVWTKISRRA